MKKSQQNTLFGLGLGLFLVVFLGMTVFSAAQCRSADFPSAKVLFWFDMAVVFGISAWLGFFDWHAVFLLESKKSESSLAECFTELSRLGRQTWTRGLAILFGSLVIAVAAAKGFSYCMPEGAHSDVAQEDAGATEAAR